MADLTTEQLQFLRHHKISESETFDATGYRTSDYKRVMSEMNKLIAYGVSKCINGHSLRTRSGKCVQCRPSAIGYLRRSMKAGFLYTAYSETLDLYKLGFAEKDPGSRIYIANLEGYGGAHDWMVRHSVWSDRAGRLESMIHSDLSDVRVTKCWVRNGQEITTRELYRKDYYRLMQAFHAHLTWEESTSIKSWFLGQRIG